MDRRAFLASGIALLTVPLAAEGQQAERVYRIGYLNPGVRPREDRPSWLAFVRGLSEQGLIAGRNVVIETRYAENMGSDRVQAQAKELVAMKVDLLVTVTTMVALEAKKVTQALPIIMAVSTDPVGGGVVESLSRPGANITGFTLTGPELTAKRLEILKASVPAMERVVLIVPGGLAVYALYLEEARRAALALGIREVVKQIIGTDPDKWEEHFIAISRHSRTGIIVSESPSFVGQSARLAALALKHRLPSAYGLGEHVQAGGLISYGTDINDVFARAGRLVGRVLLQGARPGDMPIEQPTKFDLVINLKTAKALGLTIPPSLLLRADQVIE